MYNYGDYQDPTSRGIELIEKILSYSISDIKENTSHMIIGIILSLVQLFTPELFQVWTFVGKLYGIYVSIKMNKKIFFDLVDQGIFTKEQARDAIWTSIRIVLDITIIDPFINWFKMLFRPIVNTNMPYKACSVKL